MKTVEIIDEQIKELKEKIEILEEQKKQLNWEDKCFKIDGDTQEVFIRVHKLINKTVVNVKVLCDAVVYESDCNLYQFAFNTELSFDILLLNQISLNEFRQNIKRIYNNLNKQI
jgi:hypothetical protein